MHSLMACRSLGVPLYSSLLQKNPVVQPVNSGAGRESYLGRGVLLGVAIEVDTIGVLERTTELELLR